MTKTTKILAKTHITPPLKRVKKRKKNIGEASSSTPYQRGNSPPLLFSPISCLRNSMASSAGPLLRLCQGFWGNMGKRVFISEEQGNKGQILRGTVEQRQYLGTGNMRKQIFDFWGTGEQANLFQVNKGTGTPLGWPHF